MNVVVIDYGLGNTRSVMGAVRKLGAEVRLSSQEADLKAADRLILPGVGAFGDGMKRIRESGLDRVLNECVNNLKKPILGVCLGAQLMCERSEEFGDHEGLGWIKADVRKLDVSKQKDLKLPHVGWNSIVRTGESVLWEGIPEDALFYFVHSYGIRAKEARDVLAECSYGETFAAVYKKDNILGTQFHPEKSQFYGLELLRNFLEKV